MMGTPLHPHHRQRKHDPKAHNSNEIDASPALSEIRYVSKGPIPVILDA
jgi:hypothetical protein